MPSRVRRRRDDRAATRPQPARVRRRRHRRARAHHALPRKAVVGRSLLRHDQHRHLRARARDPRLRWSPGKNYDFSNDLFPRMLRDGQARSTATSPTTTGPTSATCSSTSRRTTTRSTARVTVEIAGTSTRRAFGPARTCTSTPTRTLHGPLGARAQRHDRTGRDRRRADDDRRLGASSRRRAPCIARSPWEDVYVGERRELDGCTIADRNIDQGPRDDQRRRGHRRAAARSAAARPCRRTSSCGPISRSRRARSSRCR